MNDDVVDRIVQRLVWLAYGNTFPRHVSIELLAQAILRACAEFNSAAPDVRRCFLAMVYLHLKWQEIAADASEGATKWLC